MLQRQITTLEDFWFHTKQAMDLIFAFNRISSQKQRNRTTNFSWETNMLSTRGCSELLMRPLSIFLESLGLLLFNDVSEKDQCVLYVDNQVSTHA